MEYRLTEEEIKNLSDLHKKLKNKNDAYKINCLILWGKGWSWEDIKEALLINESTISHITKSYKNYGLKYLLGNNYKGNNRKMTPEQEKTLCDHLDKNLVINAAHVCDFIKKKFKLTYTTNGMVKTLKRLGYVYKKPKGVPSKLPSVEKQIECAEKINKILDNLKSNETAYFLDGSGFEHNAKLHYGWIKKGTDKAVKTNSGRQKININGAYNPLTQDTICVETEKPVNSQTNIKLIDKIIKYNPDKNVFYVFVDNAMYNKSKILMEYVKDLELKKGIKIKFEYILPYSPNLNLIERVWRKGKNILLANKYYEKFSDFKQTVIRFFTNEIRKKRFRQILEKSIGRKFQIIELIS
jgi:transposase